MKRILSGSLLIICLSCQRNPSLNILCNKTVCDTFKLVPYIHPLDDCLDTTLRKCFSLGFLPFRYDEGNDDYYYAYFFQKDSVDYFTVWRDDFPTFWLLEGKNSENYYDYYWFVMSGKDVIFAKRHDDHRELPFKSSIGLLAPEDVKYIPSKDEDIRTTLGLRTFRYYFDGEKYHIGGLRDTIYFGGERPRFGDLRDTIYFNGISWETSRLKYENKKNGWDPEKLHPVFE